MYSRYRADKKGETVPPLPRGYGGVRFQKRYPTPETPPNGGADGRGAALSKETAEEKKKAPFRLSGVKQDDLFIIFLIALLSSESRDNGVPVLLLALLLFCR